MDNLSVYVFAIRVAAILFPFAALLAFIPICIRQYQRFGRLAAWRLTVVYAFIFFLMAAYALVLLPLPDVTPDFCDVYGFAPQLTPFGFVGPFVDIARDSGLRALLTSFTFLEVFFNGLLLLPLGFFLRYLFQVRFVYTVGIALIVSLSFEVTQLTGIYGIYPCAYRTFSVDDLILNTLGSVVGYALVGLLPFLPEVDRESLVTSSGDVSLLRRSIAFFCDIFALSIVDLLSGPVPSILIYAVWFGVIPAVTGGYTLGKRIVRIRLASLGDHALRVWQPFVRYAVMFGTPLLLLDYVVAPLSRPEPEGYVDGVKALLALAIPFAAFLAYVIPLVVRSDHRSIPDWIARTTQVANKPAPDVYSNAIKKRPVS